MPAPRHLSLRRPRPVRPSRDPERGALLMVVLLLMLALLGLGLTGLWLASGNLQVGGNINQRLAALYVAEAGVERAKAILNGAASVNSLLAGSTPASDNIPTGVDSTGTPNGIGAIMLDGSTRMLAVSWPPASFARSAGSATSPLATSMGTYTVWIRNDTADCRAGYYTIDTNGTVLIHSQGLAPDGRTQVVLEVALGGVPGSPGFPGSNTSGGSGDYGGKNDGSDNSSTVGNLKALF